jgi:hypothetical protein
MKNKRTVNEYPIPEQSTLALWCDEQRRLYKAGLLSKDQIKKLNDIGFDWDFVSCPIKS